jgi:D-beta-D-heptose 7-phosphate kinase/D-beta-D-heptose 1-phosphate adenosyltransferase
VAGGAGNAANNVAALGARAALVALVGRDDPGRRLLASLHAGVDARQVIRTASPTTVKTRILAGGIHSAKQQVVRIDRAFTGPLDKATRASFERAGSDAARRDAVLISDYGSGLVTPALAARIVAAWRQVTADPVLIDTAISC